MSVHRNLLLLDNYIYEKGPTAIFTVYKGKFQQPKVTKVVVKLDGITTTLTTSSGCYG